MLTFMETKVILEDGVAIGGKKLREIYEVINHKKAYRYVKNVLTKISLWTKIQYALLVNEFLPISVSKENRLDYYNTLERYAVNSDLTPFADFVAELEEAQFDEYMKLI